MIGRVMRLRFVPSRLLVLALATAACSSDPYPFNGPPHAGQLNPATVGVPIQAVLVFIQIRPGDRLTFIGAEPIGLADGATVTFAYSPPLISADGGTLIGESQMPLAGMEATSLSSSPSPINNVGIVGEMTAQRPGRYVLRSIRLRYRLNGGPEQVRDGIDVIWTVCADDPAPTDCSDASPAPH